MFTLAVALSVFGLLLGPLFMAWTRASRLVLAAVDGVTLGLVPGLLLLRLLPHLVEEAGPWAVATCAAGYLAFWALESQAHGRATHFGLAIVLPTLAVHGFVDGAGLALSFERTDVLGDSALAVGGALVLHKIPEGLFVASVLPDARGAKSWWCVSALAVATLAGAWSGRALLAHTPEAALHVVIALGLGVMLRMAIHRHGTETRARPEQIASGVAFVVSLAALLLAPDPERLLMRAQPGELSALEALAPLLLETAPFLLCALLVGESLVAAREPRDPTSSMWLATIALSFPLLGPAFTLAFALSEPLSSGAPVSVGAELPWALRARRIASQLAPRAREVLPSYCCGVVIAVAIEAAVPGHGLRLGPGTLPLLLALSALLRIGAAGVTVVAALLAHKGLPTPLALLFTVLAGYASSPAGAQPGPRRILRTLALSGAAMCALYWTDTRQVPPLHMLATHPHPGSEWLSAAVLGVWALGQLLREGPRAWLTQPHLRKPA